MSLYSSILFGCFSFIAVFFTLYSLLVICVYVLLGKINRVLIIITSMLCSQIKVQSRLAGYVALYMVCYWLLAINDWLWSVDLHTMIGCRLAHYDWLSTCAIWLGVDLHHMIGCRLAHYDWLSTCTIWLAVDLHHMVFFFWTYSRIAYRVLATWCSSMNETVWYSYYINAHNVSPPCNHIPAWVDTNLYCLVDTQTLLSWAINEKVGSLGNQTGDPPVSELKHLTTQP